jgi:hypothetical protein
MSTAAMAESEDRSPGARFDAVPVRSGLQHQVEGRIAAGGHRASLAPVRSATLVSRVASSLQVGGQHSDTRAEWFRQPDRQQA